MIMMRKLLLTTLLAVSTLLSAQVTITMEQEGGVYKVPCKVNGAKMKFIFDTGAATVCLSESMAEYLLDNDYLSKEDFIGVGTSMVADGRTVNNLQVILKDIEIGGLHLKNVEASVVEGQRAPLLLGQTAIQQLGKYAIKGNLLYIYEGQSGARMNERRKIYNKLVSYNYNLGNFEDYNEALDSDGDMQKWVYDELTFVDTYPQFEQHKNWFATLKRFCDKVKNEPNILDDQLYKLFPEFKNKKKLLDAAYQYKNTIEKKTYNIHTLMEKFPEFFRVDGWWEEDGASMMVNERANDYKDYMDFFRHVCGTSVYDMDQLSLYYYAYETSKDASDYSRALLNLKSYYYLLWKYQEPTLNNYAQFGYDCYRISCGEPINEEGLNLSIVYLEKYINESNEQPIMAVYESLGHAYYLLGDCNYALSTWFKGMSVNGFDYLKLSSIIEAFGDFSYIPYKIFLCMQEQDGSYNVTWKKNYLTIEIVNELSEKWEDAYLELKAGKISPEEAVLKSSVRTEKLGELIYYLDQLYFEKNNKHNRDLLERAVLCGDKDAFDILRDM